MNGRLVQAFSRFARAKALVATCCVTALAVSACATSAGRPASPEPSRIVQWAEDNFAYGEARRLDLEDSSCGNDTSCVMVRRVACTRPATDRLACRYEVSPCYSGGESPPTGGWCGRQSTFVRSADRRTGIEGWTVEHRQ